MTPKRLLAALLCLFLLTTSACSPGAADEPTQSPSVSPSPPAISSEEPEPSPPVGEEDAPVQEEAVLDKLCCTDYGCSIRYDSARYEVHSYVDSDSFWHDTGVYLSISLIPGASVYYVLTGLQLQESIDAEPADACIGTGFYPAQTLDTVTAEGLFRRFWVIPYGEDTLLIEQSYPNSGDEGTLHQAVQQAMLDTLTLDYGITPAENSTTTAYMSVLTDLYFHFRFPDSESEWGISIGPMEDNRFAVFDVDGDGRNELLVEYTSTIVAGQRLLIYDYDAAANRVQLQFQVFPDVTFYDNGAIKAGASHNQGTSGGFWPYDLYFYESSSDSYAWIGSVSAWDQSLPIEGYPAEADTSGTGFVYYLPGSSDPVDYEVYRQWWDSYMGAAAEVSVPYASLTPEHIQDLGN